MVIQRKTSWRAHLIGGALGLLALAASIEFPEERSWTQILLVTILVGYVSVGDVWRQRRDSGFGSGLLIAGVSHSILWAALWRYLPMHILNLLVIGGIEAIAVLVVMYKTMKIRE